MSTTFRRIPVLLAALALTVFATTTADVASAAKKAKSVQTEAQWVKYDAEAKQVTVKVKKAGRKVKPKEAAVKNGKEATFDVIPEGSILTRTSVAINGKKGDITDIPAGKTVNIYWVVDEAKTSKRFARKIDVILSEDELNERYKLED